MISITLQVIMLATFIGLLGLVWRVSRQPRQRMRAVIYGWGASILWAVLWALILPMSPCSAAFRYHFAASV